ncbi:MAG: YidC/Oxa1 family membrane protein insertase [Oscillospiraceae bacterium]|jgi:YidC/Oxa1 family membrane protein insertase|nr:YidC/Oxa1 family membrane protein insertase [Oscillospiraceae bacterium]
MNFINQILGYPLGWIMWALYNLFKNYGVALFIFTLIIKAATFPLSLKQQKSTSKMSRIQPQITELQNRYKNNKEKLNEEMMALYQKEGYNPMSGCLPLLIQMPILFGMIDVIYNPLKHILRLPADIIEAGMEILSGITGAPAAAGAQLDLISNIKLNPGAFSVMGQDIIQQITDLNLTFFGMDLTIRPSVSMFGEIFTNFNPVILIPILSGVSALAASLQSMRVSAASSSAGGGMKGMMYIMPIFSVMIAFSVAAGVGLYWFFSNILSLLQTAILTKIYNPKEIAEKAQKELEERQERERQERIEAKKKLREAARQGSLSDEDLPKAMTAKELNRKKLADARKRDADKYGEVYVEVTDEDLM